MGRLTEDPLCTQTAAITPSGGGDQCLRGLLEPHRAASTEVTRGTSEASEVREEDKPAGDTKAG